MASDLMLKMFIVIVVFAGIFTGMAGIYTDMTDEYGVDRYEMQLGNETIDVWNQSDFDQTSKFNNTLDAAVNSINSTSITQENSEGGLFAIAFNLVRFISNGFGNAKALLSIIGHVLNIPRWFITMGAFLILLITLFAFAKFVRGVDL